MMLPPDPGVLETLIRDRQNRNTLATNPAAHGGGAVRVRIGHALIVAGSRLTGERMETPRRTSIPRHA